MDIPEISKKDLLDSAWKFFQQHAQQKISYFNFFVVFSTILVSGYINALNTNIPIIGIIIGVLQVVISFMFMKIDERNKFLIKISENVIKQIEKDSGLNENYLLFNKEELYTDELRKEQKGKPFYLRQISHGQAYLLIYRMFMFVGFIAFFYATLLLFSKKNTISQKEIDDKNRFEIMRIISQRDSSFSTKIDSLKFMIQKNTLK